MAILDIARPAPVGPSNLLLRAVASFSAWNDARVTRKSLSKLSLHELDDIGLMPGDIDRLAEGQRV